jgi:hemerythrin superfamily protein
MFGIGTTENDAIELLKSDHKEVDELFDDYEARKEEGKGAGKAIIARQICEALTMHATIEEEIFYPAVRKRVKEAADLVDEAAVEHQTLKDIIARLEEAPINDPLRDAGVKVLSEYVKHHVKEEENELFPKVRASDLDLEALGSELRLRKAELEGGRSKKRAA